MLHSVPILHVHVHAARPSLYCFPVHAASPCPCCVSKSMLPVHVHTTCPWQWCIFKSMMQVNVYSACPCPHNVSMSMLQVQLSMSLLYVHVYPPSCCKSMSMLHVQLSVFVLLVHVHCWMSVSMLHVHINVVCLHPCCMFMHTQDMDTGTDTVTNTVLVMVTDTNRNRDTEEGKRIFRSKLMQIKAYIRFLDLLCFEANILKRITANWIEYFYTNIHESKRIFSK
jgi:hypothetical protein